MIKKGLSNLQRVSKMTEICENLAFKTLTVVFVIFGVILPFQTLLVTYFISNLGFVSYLAFWKEGLSILVIILLGLNIFLNIAKLCIQNGSKKSSISLFLTQNQKYVLLKLLPIILFTFSFILIGVFSYFNSITIKMFIYGFRFELFWLFLGSVIVTWVNFVDNRDKLKQLSINLTKSLLSGFILISTFSISLLVFGQQNILPFFGFGSISKDTSIITAPVCHPIDAFIESCRLSGGFSFPNHFAAYLIIILGVLAYLIGLKSKNQSQKLVPKVKNSNSGNLFENEQSILLKSKSKFENILSLISERFRNKQTLILLIALTINLTLNFASYTRFALLGILMFVIYFGIKLVNQILLLLIKHNKSKRDLFVSFFKFLNKYVLIISIIIPFSIGLFSLFGGTNVIRNLPVFISKPSSTDEHLRRFEATIEVINAEPARLLNGYGLGVTGPAAKKEYLSPFENPLFISHQAIAYNHRLVGEDLTNPENWFLQVLLNGGIFYFVFYILTLIFVFILKYDTNKNRYFLRNNAFVISFFGLVIGNLFLHIFENQTVVFLLCLTSFIDLE